MELNPLRSREVPTLSFRLPKRSGPVPSARVDEAMRAAGFMHTGRYPVIEVDEQFEVPAPVAEVWQLLADPYAMVGCVPGAAITGEQADGSLDTTLSIKFGPVGVAFQARAVLELDAAARRGRLSARGRDKQGGARFEATASFSVAEHPTGSGSVVATHGQVEISGRLASVIEGGASVVVKRMSAEFASCLSARCLQPN